MDQASQQANAQAQQQRDALNNLVNQLKTQQESGLMGINNGVEDSKQALEDKSFQDWLAARQSMANKGLSGSGLASDQDTRLLLQKQRDLSGIYRDAEQQKYTTNSTASNNLTDAYNKIAQINPEIMKDQLYQQMLGTAQKSLTDKAGMYSDMLKNIMGYEMPTAGEQLTYQSAQNATNEKAAEAQANIDQKNQAALGYITLTDSKGKTTSIPTLEAIKANQKYSLDLTNSTGYLYGANGKPILGADGKPIATTDRARLDEQIRHDQVGEGISQQNANTGSTNAATNQSKLIAQVKQWSEENKIKVSTNNIRKSELAHQIDKDEAMINNAKVSMSDVDKAKIDVLKTRLSNINSQMNAAMGSVNGDGTVPQYLTDKYKEVSQQLEGILNNASFSNPSGGGDTSTPTGKLSGSYTNLYKTNKLGGEMSTSYQNTAAPIKKALADKGLPSDWLPYLWNLQAVSQAGIILHRTKFDSVWSIPVPQQYVG
jgi:hypothetical protein